MYKTQAGLIDLPNAINVYKKVNNMLTFEAVKNEKASNWTKINRFICGKLWKNQSQKEEQRQTLNEEE